MQLEPSPLLRAAPRSKRVMLRRQAAVQRISPLCGRVLSRGGATPHQGHKSQVPLLPASPPLCSHLHALVLALSPAGPPFPASFHTVTQRKDQGKPFSLRELLGESQLMEARLPGVTACGTLAPLFLFSYFREAALFSQPD